MHAWIIDFKTLDIFSFHIEQLSLIPYFNFHLSQFLDNSKAVCGTAAGDIKIYDITTGNKKTPIFTLDNAKIKVSSKSEDSSATTTSLNPSTINCMAVYDGLVIYGDNGFNIKVLDYQKGLCS